MINEFYFKKVLRLVEQGIIYIEEVKEPYKTEVIKFLKQQDK